MRGHKNFLRITWASGTTRTLLKSEYHSGVCATRKGNIYTYIRLLPLLPSPPSDKSDLQPPLVCASAARQEVSIKCRLGTVDGGSDFEHFHKHLYRSDVWLDRFRNFMVFHILWDHWMCGFSHSVWRVNGISLDYGIVDRSSFMLGHEWRFDRREWVQSIKHTFRSSRSRIRDYLIHKANRIH